MEAQREIGKSKSSKKNKQKKTIVIPKTALGSQLKSNTYFHEKRIPNFLTNLIVFEKKTSKDHLF